MQPLTFKPYIYAKYVGPKSVRGLGSRICILSPYESGPGVLPRLIQDLRPSSVESGLAPFLVANQNFRPSSVVSEKIAG